VLVVVAIALFNLLAPPIFETSPDVRFVPAVDLLEDALSIALLASPIFVAYLIARRVRPSWGGLRLWTKILYVGALVVVQSGVVIAGEMAIFSSRGGLRLFDPVYSSSAFSLDGRTAHVYTTGGLRCGYDVFVSGPFSLTGRRVLAVSRSTCVEPRPRLQWHPDGSVRLVDAANKPLESQPSPVFSLFGGGC
jgi:hypothetical protein